MAKINLVNGKSFNNEPGQSLLESARQSGLVLEHSCRTGRCGVCKALVIDGKTRPLQFEEALSPEDISKNYILTCCRTAETDVELNIEDLSDFVKFQPKTVPCRIDNLSLLAPDVIETTLRMPPSGGLEYLPGQYVDVIGRDGLRRSYSIANAPRSDGKIILQIRRVPNGLMSRYWFEEAAANDMLRMEGPLGTFCLRNSSAAHLILLATGTGIAPIKAMLEQLAENPALNTYEQIHLYWGGRTQQDLYWHPSFPTLALTFTPVLSRESDWNGAKGHVQNVLLADQLDLSDAIVFACGSEAMINSAREQLTRAGLKEKSFYADAFVSSN